MTTIYTPLKQKILFVVEVHEDGRRFRWTRIRTENGTGDVNYHNDWEEVPDVGPLLMIPEGPDVDGVAVRDLVQMAKQKPRREREKPDITGMYQRFNEVRKRELDSKTVHPVAKVNDGQ
jgi:hypothetical protein